jgi:DNA-binding Lrp family transcriptional regulator
MKRLDIQKILSIDGYWTVNKHLAKEYGFTATILLQQLIELQCEYFKDGDFYQQQDQLAEKLGISEKVLVAARKKLVDANLLVARRGYLAKYYYTVLLDNITAIFEVDDSDSPKVTKGNIPKLQKVSANRKKQEQKETKQKEVLDVPSQTPDIDPIDDIKAKIFFRIVDAYPQNRIGNRQHGLKKFKKLDINQAKLAATNLTRYLKSIDIQYAKSLQNYITEACYTEGWLKANEKTTTKDQKINTKTFKTNYNESVN